MQKLMLFLIILFALPMLFIALAIKLTSKGPVFYRQERSSLVGRAFNILKFRTMDTKDWEGLAETLTEDATSAYDSGNYSFDGREAILGFLTGALGSPSIVSQHQGHHPEITFNDANSAHGVWYLEDYVIFGDTGTGIRGAAFYEDDYVKVDGQWKICTTGYRRTYEELVNRDAVQHTRTMFDAAD